MPPRIIRRAVLGLAAVALLASCGDDDTATTSTTTSTTTSAAADDTDLGATADDPATDDAEPPTDASDAAAGTLLEVSVEGGTVTGGGRHDVALGDTVTIRVTSDVADHAHLHGYDVLVDVPAGGTADLVFEADIPGVFEVELEDARIPLLELAVS